jgi:hypothetical protein
MGLIGSVILKVPHQDVISELALLGRVDPVLVEIIFESLD